MPAFSIASRPLKSSDILLAASEPPPPSSVACCAHQVQSFDLSQTFWCRGLWGHGFNDQSFGADKQVPKGGCGPCPKNDAPRVIGKQEVFRPTRNAERKGRIPRR